MANPKKKEPTKLDRFAKKFWSALLFTKDGRPKSGFGVYTFFIALILGFLYGGAIIVAITLLNPILSANCAPWLENLIESLCSAVIVGALASLFHYMLPDKKLIFASYVWLIVFAVAVSVTMAILLYGTGATGTFFAVFFWFAYLPVGIGAVLSYVLFHRDYKPEPKAEEIPEYMKYIRRR